MRKIKYRFWDGKQMYDWGWAQEYQVEHVFSPDVEDWKVMLFTGLLDCHGKEIYEGDVCVWPSGINREIIWDERNACFSTPLYKLQVEKGLKTILGQHIEIIGNIYENPELITPTSN